ncbi:MAG: TrmH family RNA methyltransferase [Chlorobi bacterium]|nr:TrmH family RNA methyltransferase [Chlorobiota bacterium]
MEHRRLSFDDIATLRAETHFRYGALRHPIGVMLWNVRSAYNVGSIFRTCDATRVEQLVLCGYTPNPTTGKVHKTSLGAEQTVPWVHIANPFEAFERQRRAGHRILAVELAAGARSYATLTAEDFPATFVFGNELVGISDELLRASDDAIVIPMFGEKHSLNVAVSVGVVLYRALETLGVLTAAEFVLRPTAP